MIFKKRKKSFRLKNKSKKKSFRMLGQDFTGKNDIRKE